MWGKIYVNYTQNGTKQKKLKNQDVNATYVHAQLLSIIYIIYLII